MFKSIFATLVLVTCHTSFVHAQQSGGGGGGGTSGFGLGGTFGSTGTTGGTTSAPLASNVASTIGTTGGTTTGGTAAAATGAASGLSNFGVGSSFGTFDSGFGATTLGTGATAGLLSAFSRGGIGSSFGGGRGNTNQNNQNNQNNQTKIRATVKIGFDYPRPSPQAQTQAVVARLNRVPLPPKFSSVSIQMRERIAVITGSVPSEADGKLIERLLSLEMGIDGVENNLVIDQAAAAGEVVPRPASLVP